MNKLSIQLQVQLYEAAKRAQRELKAIQVLLPHLEAGALEELNNVLADVEKKMGLIRPIDRL